MGKQTTRSGNRSAPAPPPAAHVSPEWALALGLAALTLVAFVGACQNDFVDYDDPVFVTENPNVRAGLTADAVAWALTATESVSWHPLTWWSLQLDAEVYGVDPAGFHFTNVLLHTASAVLLFWALRLLTGSLWPSAIAAALFAIHPLRVESVAWVTERKDTLGTFFWMLTLLAYAHYARRPRVGSYLLVVGPFALGLLAKQTLVTLPCVLLLLDFWPLGRWRPGSRVHVVLEKLPLLGLSVAAGLAAIAAQGGSIRTLDQFPLDLRLGNALIAYAQYLGMFVWPADLAAFYPHPRLGVLSAPALSGAALLIAVTGVAAWQARRRPYLLVGWLWYLGTMAPMIGLLQYGGHGRADRNTYIPLVGLTIAAVWGLAELVARRPQWRPHLRIATAAVLALLLIATWRQVGYWRDTVHLWRHALDVSQENYEAHRNLAAVLERQGHLDEARDHYQKALALHPDRRIVHIDLGALLMRRGEYDSAHAHLQAALQLAPDDPMAHTNLGALLLARGQPAEAEAHLWQAVRRDPGLASAHFNLALACVGQDRVPDGQIHFAAGDRLQPGNAAAHQGFGAALRDRGHPDLAEPYLRAAVALQPDNPEAHHDLGLALQDRGAASQAVVQYRNAVRLKPREVTYLLSLAHASWAGGDRAAADAHYREAGRIDPTWPARVNDQAWRLAAHPDARQRQGRRAVRLAEQACQATGDDHPDFLDTLAAAYAEVGRFDDAVERARKAGDRATAAGAPALAREVQDRLRLYEARRPFRAQLAQDR